MQRALLSIFIALALCTTATAWAQSVELSVRSGEIYAEVPFVLQVAATGFEESPEPKVVPFQIDGAKVTFLGMSPNVSSHTSIVNGRISRSRQVQFVFAYRVEVAKPGNYAIPAIVVAQDDAKAASKPTQFRAQSVADTREMRIELEVPKRPVWIGESFDVTINWYLRLNPREPTFVIPLFEHPAFDIAAPETSSRDTLSFSVGGTELELPYETEKARLGGVEYTRFQFRAVATPSKAGTYELNAPRVVASLRTGTGRDSFGFPSARHELFKATGTANTFEVKSLPVSGRPESFSNAVGSGFSIQVTSSRSVVSVGEPIELTITVGGKHGLKGLSLPNMLGPGRLDPKYFDVLDDSAVGVLSDDGKSKVFTVTAILKSAEARTIPAIEFGYFDPVQASYKTAKSQPIALNVTGSATVGSGDVVSATGKEPKAKKPDRRVQHQVTFAGDLTPSNPKDTLRTVTSIGAIAPALWALYVAPILLFLIAWYRRKTQTSRGQGKQLKALWDAVDRALAQARTAPASESAAPLVNAVQKLARGTGAVPGDWLAALENLAFDPVKSKEPVSDDLLATVRREAKNWRARGLVASGKTGVSASAVLLLFVCLHPRIAVAENIQPASVDINQARTLYSQALTKTDRNDRLLAFTQAKEVYAELSSQYPDRPELLADWGNAALGANDLGTAVLAYRRALRLDNGLTRAQANLDWIRQQLPEHLVSTEQEGAVDSLLFWHGGWSLATRHLAAAIAFFCAVLLVAPWGLRFEHALRRFAILFFVLFCATLGSALLQTEESQAAVVVSDGQTLYSADSLGAPPAMPILVPAGAEVTMRERRGNWSRVAFADGTVGWLNGGRVELVSDGSSIIAE